MTQLPSIPNLDRVEKTQSPLGEALKRVQTTDRAQVSVIIWTPNTQFVIGQVISNGGNRYICTTGGLSASSGGPIGTGAGIADNTVVWAFYNPAQGNRSTIPFIDPSKVFG